MFWQRSNETILSRTELLFELREQVRSKDRWHMAVLGANRTGQETWEMYCFTHGLPTEHVGSWCPLTGEITCGNVECRKVQDERWPEMFRRRTPWETRRLAECPKCQEERARRCRVLPEDGEDARAMHQRFAVAPYVHPFNKPKYHAQICHALQYAKVQKKKLYWCIAHDWPDTSEEESL